MGAQKWQRPDVERLRDRALLVGFAEACGEVGMHEGTARHLLRKHFGVMPSALDREAASTQSRSRATDLHGGRPAREQVTAPRPLVSIFDDDADADAETAPHLRPETPQQWAAGHEPVTSEGAEERGRDEPSPDPARMLEDRAAERDRRRLKGERDALLEQLEEANARAFYVDRIAAPHVPRILPREPVSGMREGALVALASDWHLEEVVSLESTAGRNEYNLEIGVRRAHRFFDGIRWLLAHHRHDFAIRDLILWFGGDFFSGFIHDELRETNELSPIESVLHVKQVLSDGLHTMLADPLLERIVVPTSFGNHSRVTEKRRIKNGAEMSYEWLLYNVLASEFAHEPRVTFEIARSAHTYVEAYGRTLHFHHGDDVVYHGGVGGLNVPLGKRVPQWDTVRFADLHHIGHFHQCRDFGRAVVNGSLIGYNDYAMSIGAGYEEPQQQSYVLDAKRGKCMVTPIWVSEDRELRGAAA